MKDQILKLAGVKSEAAFYKKFPNTPEGEEAFMKMHGKAFKKAAMGASMVKKQLTQLTDFSNPPQAEFGVKSPYDPSISGFGKKPSLDTSAPRALGDLNGPTAFGMRNSTDTSKMFGNYQSGQSIGKGLDKKAGMPPIKGEKGSDATAYLQAGMDVVEGISMIKDQNLAVKQAKQNSMLTGVQAQAVGSQKQQPLKNYYTRPEDTIVQANQLGSAYGTGTNILSAQDGAMVGGNPTEIQNTYDPNDVYTNLGYEPLNDSDKIKAFYHGGNIPRAQGGFETFMTEQGGGEALGNLSNMFINKGRGPSAGSKIGGGVGQAAGQFFGGNVGGKIGKFAGEFIGGAIDQSGKHIDEFNQTSNTNMAGMMGSYMPQQFGNVLEDGGYISNDWQPQVITKFGEYNMDELFKPDPTMDTLRSGGSLKQNYIPPSARALQTYDMGGDVSSSNLGGVEVESGGYLEPISYNPYNDGTGVTSMIRGQSHDEYDSKLGHSGVMLHAYSPENKVEVERGELIREMEQGGEVGEDKSAVITGNLVYKNLSGIPDTQYKKYEGKKIKNIHKEIALKDQKLNKKQEKNINALADFKHETPSDRLYLGTLEANKLGYDMQYADNATAANYFTEHQSIVNGTAKKYNLVAENLAKGKVTIDKEALKTSSAKWGDTIDKAQAGKYISKYKLAPWEGNKDKLGAKTKSMYNAQQWDKIAENLGFKGKGNKEFQEFLLKDPNRAKLIKSKSKELYGSEDVKLDEKLGAAFNIPELGRAPLDTSGLKTLNTKTNLLGNNFPNWNEKLQERLQQDVPELTKRKKDFDWMGVVNQALPYFRPSDQEELDPRQLTGEMYALSQNELEPVQAQTYQPQLQTPIDISLQDQLNEITAQTREAQRLARGNPEALAAIAAQAEMARNKVLGEQMRINQGQKAQTYAANIGTLNDAQLKNLQAYAVQQGKQDTAKSLTKATTQAALSSIASKFAQNQLANRQLAAMENLYNYRFDKSGRAVNMNPLAQFDLDIQSMTPAELKAMATIKEAQDKKAKSARTVASRNGSIVKAIKNL